MDGNAEGVSPLIRRKINSLNNDRMNEGLAGLAAGRIGCKRVHQQHKTAALVVEIFEGIIGSHFGKPKIWVFAGIWLTTTDRIAKKDENTCTVK
jgi:hypothetical protein